MIRFASHARPAPLRMAGVLMAGCAVFLGSTAFAQETTTYTYDALGRVRTVTHSGGSANGTSATYRYDPAGNRTNVTVAGAAGGNGSDPNGGASTPSHARIVVVPLNGFTVIPIG